MEGKEKADLSDLRQVYNFLTTSKELAIAKVALDILKRRHKESVTKARYGFRGGIFPTHERDTAAVQFMPSTLANDGWTPFR